MGNAVQYTTGTDDGGIDGAVQNHHAYNEHEHGRE
jgi:hypothetical protein